MEDKDVPFRTMAKDLLQQIGTVINATLCFHTLIISAKFLITQETLLTKI